MKDSIFNRLQRFPDKRASRILHQVFTETHGKKTVAAAGTTQATATSIAAAVNSVTGANGTAGVILPTPSSNGVGVWVINTDASNDLKKAKQDWDDLQQDLAAQAGAQHHELRSRAREAVVVQPELVAERDRVRLAAVLAADPKLDARLHRTALVARHLH